MGQTHDTWLTGIGVDIDKFRAAGAAGVADVVNIAFGHFFRPELQVLSSVGMPMLLPHNGELTIDLLVKNWDDAPKGTVMRWTASVDSKVIVAKVTNRDGEGYLTLRGITAGASGMVRVAVHVKGEELEVPFEFPPVFFLVTDVVEADAEGEAAVQMKGDGDEAAPNMSAPEITNSIFEFFWPGMGKPEYSQQAGDFAAFCFAQAVSASRKMDWVPRPPGGRPGVGWILMQAVQIAWRKITRSTEIYEAVRNVVANNQRINYDMLRNGLDPSY